MWGRQAAATFVNSHAQSGASDLEAGEHMSDTDLRLLDEGWGGQRAGRAVERPSRELASSRAETAALRRENDKLRARLRTLAAPAPVQRRTEARRPGGFIRCHRCGLTLNQAAIQHDHVLVFASCCPRCDGPLDHEAGTAAFELPRPDPSTHVG
jgi:hypothetical protein